MSNGGTEKNKVKQSAELRDKIPDWIWQFLGAKQKFTVSPDQIEALAKNTFAENIDPIRDALTGMYARRITATGIDAVANLIDLYSFYLLADFQEESKIPLTLAIITSFLTHWLSYVPLNIQDRKTKTALTLSTENIFQNDQNLSSNPDYEKIKLRVKDAITNLSTSERYVISDLYQSLFWILMNCAVVLMTNEELLIGLIFSLLLITFNTLGFLKQFPKKQAKFEDDLFEASAIETKSGGLTTQQSQDLITSGETVAKTTAKINALSGLSRIAPFLASVLTGQPVISGIYLKGLISGFIGNLGSSLNQISQGTRAKKVIDDFIELLNEHLNLMKEQDYNQFLTILASREENPTQPKEKNFKGIKFSNFNAKPGTRPIFNGPLNGLMNLGSIALLSGESGSGKSTLAKALSLKQPFNLGRFSLFLNGKEYDPVNCSREQWSKLVHYEKCSSDSVLANESFLDYFYHQFKLNELSDIQDFFAFFKIEFVNDCFEKNTASGQELLAVLNVFFNSDSNKRQQILNDQTTKFHDSLVSIDQSIKSSLKKLIESTELFANDSESFNISKVFADFSKGQQQRFVLLGLLLKFFKQEGLFILDEPFAGLDQEANNGLKSTDANVAKSLQFIEKMMSLLQEKGKAASTLIITHLSDNLGPLTNPVIEYVLESGNLFANTYQDEGEGLSVGGKLVEKKLDVSQLVYLSQLIKYKFREVYDSGMQIETIEINFPSFGQDSFNLDQEINQILNSIKHNLNDLITQNKNQQNGDSHFVEYAESCLLDFIVYHSAGPSQKESTDYELHKNNLILAIDIFYKISQDNLMKNHALIALNEIKELYLSSEQTESTKLDDICFLLEKELQNKDSFVDKRLFTALLNFLNKDHSRTNLYLKLLQNKDLDFSIN